MNTAAGTGHPLWPKRGQDGWMLAEVMVAVIIAGVVVVSLAGLLLAAVAQADHVRNQARQVGGQNAGADVLCAWVWGPTVFSAEWLPGPSLRIKTRASQEASDSVMVGVWVDGWFRGEWPLDASGVYVLDCQVWTAQQGAEAIVRVRRDTESWGPPWRSLVPGVSGVVELPAEGSGGGGGSGSEFSDESRVTLVHVPLAGKPPVHPSWASEDPGETTAAPLLYTNPPAGPAGVYFEAVTQSWLSEQGRALDVYF